MEKEERRSFKARLTLIEVNLKGCRGMVANADTYKPEKFRCHVKNILENGEELLSLLGPQLHLDLDAVTTNGTEGHHGDTRHSP